MKVRRRCLEALQSVSVSKVRTGVKIDRIEGQERVTAVRLADGEEIATNLVLISCGVRANTELAEQMGLKVNRAVAVNEKMQTSEKISMHAETAWNLKGKMQSTLGRGK